jgi:endoribonuclease Dicer
MARTTSASGLTQPGRWFCTRLGYHSLTTLIISAILTAQSAVPHLEHFCAVLPNGKHSKCLKVRVVHRILKAPPVPIYDDDPPEYPEGWHLLGGRPGTEPYQGPYGATVTLPRLLPPHLRVFTVERIYPTKVSARQHVASKAYLALYEARLLNDNLLPLTSVLEPDMEEEVKTLLKDVMKRAGTADVALQMNPWAPPPDASAEMWHCSELAVTGMPALYLLTQVKTWTNETFELYTGQAHPLAARLKSVEDFNPDSATLARARDYTRTLFWSIHGNRMTWDDTDFKYLLLPTSSGPEDAVWEQRRAWWKQSCDERGVSNPATALLAPVNLFMQAFGLPTDLEFLADGYKPTATHRFLSWWHERLPEEKERELEAKLARFELRVTYPLIHGQALPRRVNFLIPSATTAEPPHAFLLPQHASLVLSPPHEVQYALLLPSVFRFMAMSMTLRSFRETVLVNTPLMAIDPGLLLVAITAPVSGEKDNYERLETLGDTALKLIASITLFAEHPFWHEGYLSR